MLFPTCLPWPATGCHHPIAGRKAPGDKCRWLPLAYLFLCLRSRANFICSPTTCIFCSNFRGNLVPIVFLVITHHIICKDNAFYLFNDRLHQNNGLLPRILADQKETYIITNKPYLCKWETDAAIATDFRILPNFEQTKVKYSSSKSLLPSS